MYISVRILHRCKVENYGCHIYEPYKETFLRSVYLMKVQDSYKHKSKYCTSQSDVTKLDKN